MINSTEPKYSEKDIHEILKVVIDVHDERSYESGIMCDTECVFGIFPRKCSFKNVILENGKCPHYNPALKYSDVIPGYPGKGTENDLPRNSRGLQT